MLHITASTMSRLALMLVLVQSCACIMYDSYSGEVMTPEKEERVRALRLVPWCGVEVKECDPTEGRRIDYTCNSLKYPSRGTQSTPYHRMLPPRYSARSGSRVSSTGRPLPNARRVRVAIMSDGRVASEEYTQLVTHVAVTITADITSVHDTVNYVGFTRTCCMPGGEADPRCIPIEVAPDDVHLRRSNVRCLNLTSIITYQRLGCISDQLPPARINSSPPMLELSYVYGHDATRADAAREKVGGRFKAELINGKEWPPNGSPFCINNDVERGETRCHDSAALGPNSVLGVNLFFMWQFRLHNAMARKLQEMNPCWDDQKLYMTARDINIAYWQNIIYYEFMPSLIGYDYLLKRGVIFNTRGHVDDYDEDLEPRVSIEYVVGSRWFHTMQEGRLKLYNRNGTIVEETAIVDFTLRTGALPLNNFLARSTIGAYRQPSAESDWLVDPDVGERILSRLQTASDVVSSDLMKDRNNGLPPYNDYREYCHLKRAKEFNDLLEWMPREQVEAFASIYESVDDIELLAGIIGERRMPGAAMGAILACVMSEQLLRWRRADRFWFESSKRPGAFTPEQLYEIRKMSTARLLCDHGDEVDTIQRYAYLVAGPGNEYEECSKIPEPSLNPWKDEQCFKPGDKPKENISDKKPEIDQGANALNQGANGFNQGADGFNQGADGFKQGADGFKQGADSFKQAANGFNQGGDGFNQLANGFNQGANGVKQVANGVYDGANGMYKIANNIYQGLNGKNQQVKESSGKRGPIEDDNGRNWGFLDADAYSRVNDYFNSWGNPLNQG